MKKKKRGRPKMPVTKSRKELIATRVSIEELRKCQNLAQKEGMSLSAWARKTLLFALND